MSGIPVFTSSPVNVAAKASGVTPQTASSGTSRTSAIDPKTTTSASTTYPAAQPGAAAVPAPTGSSQKYVPAHPTPTTRAGEKGPPAPQPGAVPRPSNIPPPPPKAGEAFHPPSPATSSQIMPPQMSIPPPTTAYAAHLPTSSTSITNSPSVPYPLQLHSTDNSTLRRSLEHPPGYQQNSAASEMTSDQRRASDAHDANMSLGAGYDGSSVGLDTGNMWATAKKWAQSAGEKISEAEAEVWRRIK